jgi:hypothetical protein
MSALASKKKSFDIPMTEPQLQSSALFSLWKQDTEPQVTVRRISTLSATTTKQPIEWDHVYAKSSATEWVPDSEAAVPLQPKGECFE